MTSDPPLTPNTLLMMLTPTILKKDTHANDNTEMGSDVQMIGLWPT
jgi:hypothetical protein